MNDIDKYLEICENDNLGFDYLFLINWIMLFVKFEILIVCMKCEEEIKVWYLKEY